MKKWSLFALMAALLFSSCLRDLDDVKVTEQTEEPEILENYDPVVENVTASVRGFVTDDAGDPVSGADVRLGSLNTQTDDYGHFLFEDVVMNSRGTLVRVENAGYFDGSRRFFPQAGEMSRIHIRLMDKVFNQSFGSSTGGTVTTSGASIVFGQDAIRTSGGNNYNGDVRVAVQWIDPSVPDVLERMPGNLQGVDVTNTEISLATYGMMAVELQSPSGERLNLRDGSTAEIRMPVPSGMQSAAPSEIPLWSYSETYGVWVEESTAQLTGSTYVGEVSHFSFWNWDYPYPLVEFGAAFVDEEGTPLANYLVTLTLNGAVSGGGWTNADGIIAGLVPAGETMELSFYNVCGEVIYSQTVGPYSEDVSLGTITVTGTDVNATRIIGTVTNCDGDPVTDLLLIAEYSGQTVYFYQEGPTFSLDITACAGTETITLTAIDQLSLEISDPVIVNAGETTNVGNLEACGELLDEYILVSIGGNNQLYAGINVEIHADSTGTDVYTFIQGISPNNPGGNEDFVMFGFEGVTAGNYDDANYIEIILSSMFGWQYSGGSFTTLEVSVYEEGAGGRIVGTFSGIVNGASGPASITGEFNVTAP